MTSRTSPVRHALGIDFKHAVEFSSFGCVPRFRLLDFGLGQLDQLYFGVFRLSNRRALAVQLVCRLATRSTLLAALGPVKLL